MQRGGQCGRGRREQAFLSRFSQRRAVFWPQSFRTHLSGSSRPHPSIEQNHLEAWAAVDPSARTCRSNCDWYESGSPCWGAGRLGGRGPSEGGSSRASRGLAGSGTRGDGGRTAAGAAGVWRRRVAGEQARPPALHSPHCSCLPPWGDDPPHLLQLWHIARSPLRWPSGPAPMRTLSLNVPTGGGRRLWRPPGPPCWAWAAQWVCCSSLSSGKGVLCRLLHPLPSLPHLCVKASSGWPCAHAPRPRPALQALHALLLRALLRLLLRAPQGRALPPHHSPLAELPESDGGAAGGGAGGGVWPRHGQNGRSAGGQRSADSLQGAGELAVWEPKAAGTTWQYIRGDLTEQQAVLRSNHLPACCQLSAAVGSDAQRAATRHLHPACLFCSSSCLAS